MPKENNKMQVDIDTLKKQNVNDLLSIKELYKRIEELGEKTSQIKYIDNTLVKKLKKEYEKLKKIILDENIQVKLNNDIETINVKLNNDIETINSQMDTKASKLHSISWYNIKELGASPKGNLNCDKIIQDIIDNSNGSIVIYAPPGKYLIDQVIIPSNKHGITFVGDVGYNYGGTQFIAQDSNKSMFKIGNHQKSGNSLDRLQGLTFKGITFKSNIELNYDLAVNKICLDVNRVSNLNIMDCYFFGFRYGAIKGIDWWDSRIDYTSFIFCGTKDLYPSIYFGGNLDNSNAIKISSCRFENSPYFIETKQDATRHIQIISCKFEPGDKATELNTEYLFKLQNSQEIVFTSNQFVANSNNYYLFYITGDSRKSIIFNGNMFSGANTGLGKWIKQDMGSGIIATGNTFVNSSNNSPFILKDLNIFNDNKIHFTYTNNVKLKAFELGQSNNIKNNTFLFPTNTSSGYVFDLIGYYNKIDNVYSGSFGNLYNFNSSNTTFLNYIKPLKRERQLINTAGDITLDYSLSDSYTLSGGTGTNIIGITHAGDGAELTVYNNSTSDITITKGDKFLSNLSTSTLTFENRSIITFKRIANQWYIKDYIKRSSLVDL